MARIRPLLLACAASVGLGALLELAYYKAGYCIARTHARPAH